MTELKIFPDFMRATLYTARNDKMNTFKYCWCYDFNRTACCNVAAQFTEQRLRKGRFTLSMPSPCRAHAVPLPCLAAKGLECVFPI